MMRNLLLAVSLATAANTANAQALTYNFNDSGTTTQNTGSGGASYEMTMYDYDGSVGNFHSNASTGGIPGPDGSISFNSTSQGPATRDRPYASSATAGALFDSASSFTVTGWYYSESVTSGQRMFSSNKLALYWISGGGFVMEIGVGQLRSDGTTSDSDVTVVSQSSTPFINDTTDEWQFFAVTYDGSAAQKVLTYYGGDYDADSSLTAYEIVYTITDDALDNAAWLSIGGNVAGGDPNIRGVVGSLDSYNFFTASDSSAALSASQVNGVRLSMIPEPATTASLFAGVILMGVAIQRMRRRTRA